MTTIIDKYPKLSDGTVDISKIPKEKNCNVCNSGDCENCISKRCHCGRANHGVPDDLYSGVEKHGV